MLPKQKVVYLLIGTLLIGINLTSQVMARNVITSLFLFQKMSFVELKEIVPSQLLIWNGYFEIEIYMKINQ